MLCTRCSLSSGVQTVCVMGDGPKPSPIMLVGEAPGAEEDREGRPFVGAAGKILRNILNDLGMSVYITNIVKCRPPSNRTPTQQEIDACRLHLVQELDEVRPSVIIALGGSALKALTGKETIGQNRSRLLLTLPIFRSSTSVMVTYHPAAGLHQPNRKKELEEAISADLKASLAYVGGGSSVTIGHTIGVGPRKNLREFLDIALKDPTLPLACDLEWEVMDKRAMWPWSSRGRITCIGFGLLREGQALAISLPLTEKTQSIIQSLLSHPLVYHNAIADLIWLKGRGLGDGVGIPKDDSILLAYLLEEESLGLKQLAPKHVGTAPGWEKLVNAGATPRTNRDWVHLFEYNATDAGVTIALVEVLKHKLMAQRPQALPLYEHLLLPSSYHFAQAALQGLPMDVNLLGRMLEATAKQMVEVRKDASAVLGMDISDTLLSSSTQLAKLLMEAGVILPTTKSGRPSVALTTLEDVHHPIVEKVTQYRKLQKLHGTYLRPWYEILIRRGDGRMHTIYRITSTVTGRTSSEGEAGGTVQQFPRGSGMRKLVRARPGWVIFNADQSQIELRIAAWLASESTMLELYQRGVDIHRATAAWVRARSRGMNLSEFRRQMDSLIALVGSDQRQAAKAVNFGLIYGGQAGIVVDSARRDYGVEMSMTEAESARQGFFAMYPKLLDWHEEAWQWVRKGYVDTPFGLRRNLSQIGENSAALLRKAINTPVQGTASYITQLAFCRARARIDAEGLSKVALLTDFIHDSILGEIRADYLDEVSAIVREEMEHPDLSPFHLELTVPLVADITVGETWG